MTLRVPADFSLWSTIRSHGWSALPPFQADPAERTLRIAVRLSPSTVVTAVVSQPSVGRLSVLPSRALSPSQERRLGASVRSCLRLDEEYGAFYESAAARPAYRWVAEIGAGRMLRSPSVFEDVVKMVCTTNCSWALTKIMTARLCETLGQELPGTGHAFPTPEALASSSDAFLRSKVRTGYRAPYLLAFARGVDRGTIDCESWRTSPLATPELLEEISSVKGVGPYAAANILKLVGRYDALGIDSWCRARYAEAFHGGRRVSDRTIERRYPAADPWRGLFFWMDMTKEWYRDGA
jgi:N-glycosylase/DNA lyase